MKTRACPCGARLEKKSYESNPQYEKRKYCNSTCKGRYHKDPPKTHGFGLKLSKNKMIGRGLHRYLDDRPLYEITT